MSDIKQKIEDWDNQASEQSETYEIKLKAREMFDEKLITYLEYVDRKYAALFDRPIEVCGTYPEFNIFHELLSKIIDLAIAKERERMTKIIEAQYKQHIETMRQLKDLTNTK